MKSNKTTLAMGAVIVLLAILAGAGAALLNGAQTPPTEPVSSSAASSTRTVPATTEADVDWGRTVEQDGVRYELNPSLHPILFLGADDGGAALADTTPGEGRRADTILLLVLDDANKQTRLLAISRDTMADVDVYDASGRYAYTAPTHINMQYFYGDSPTRSCFLTKRAVSRLLYGIRIDGCLALNANGIVTIVDLLGGLTVTMPEDYTEIDARYAAGETLTLTGAETERLLRYRDTAVHGSNEARVERQLRLIKALVEKLQQSIGASRLEELLNAAGSDVCSDLDAETLKKLVSYRLDPDTLTLPGTVVEGEAHDEFHVDNAALRKLLIELLYQPAS